jgi:hypothetical protein
MVKLLPAPQGPRSATVGMASSERSYPLVALLQLATFWAALAACVDGAKLRSMLDLASQNMTMAAAAIIAAFVLGGLLGSFVGMGQLRMWRSAVAGFAAGGLCGGAILAVYAAPAPPARALGAAATLVLTTIAFRCRAA